MKLKFNKEAALDSLMVVVPVAVLTVLLVLSAKCRQREQTELTSTLRPWKITMQDQSVVKLSATCCVLNPWGIAECYRGDFGNSQRQSIATYRGVASVAEGQ